jgi:MFS family permease
MLRHGPPATAGKFDRGSEMNASLSSSSAKMGSPLSPFRHPAFAVIWSATVIANVGSWMYSAASGWLMTSLNPDPLIVSLVQVATTLPMFLVAIPAGALADILDIRKFLIVSESAYTLMSAIFAAIVWLGLATPANLLLFTFLTGVAAALTAPTWQAVVPRLVPRQDLHQAVAANGVGINVSRAVGPALGGVMVAKTGIASPFWFNAISNLGDFKPQGPRRLPTWSRAHSRRISEASLGVRGNGIAKLS